MWAGVAAGSRRCALDQLCSIRGGDKVSFTPLRVARLAHAQLAGESSQLPACRWDAPAPPRWRTGAMRLGDEPTGAPGGNKVSTGGTGAGSWGPESGVALRSD